MWLDVNESRIGRGRAPKMTELWKYHKNSHSCNLNKILELRIEVFQCYISVVCIFEDLKYIVAVGRKLLLNYYVITILSM